MQRRNFMRMCAASAALAAAPIHAATNLTPRFYSRARLVDERRQPLRAGTLAVGQNYVFHYPFEGTPCFLLNLGKPTGQRVALRTEDGSGYDWPGGVGPPARDRRLFGDLFPPPDLPDAPDQLHQLSRPLDGLRRLAAEHHPLLLRAQRIRPASGARVLNGPAPQPLSAILLEYEPATDGLYAVGTLGGELFNAFFAKYELKLELDYGSGRARQRVGGQTLVTELANFCKQQVRC